MKEGDLKPIYTLGEDKDKKSIDKILSSVPKSVEFFLPADEYDWFMRFFFQDWPQEYISNLTQVIIHREKSVNG